MISGHVGEGISPAIIALVGPRRLVGRRRPRRPGPALIQPDISLPMRGEGVVLQQQQQQQQKH